MTTSDEFIALLRERIDSGIGLLRARGVTEAEIAELILDMEDISEKAKLDLNNCNTCVLAAVYGSYSDGLDALGLNLRDAAAYGFDLGRGNCDGYDELTWQWRLRLGIDGDA